MKDFSGVLEDILGSSGLFQKSQGSFYEAEAFSCFTELFLLDAHGFFG